MVGDVVIELLRGTEMPQRATEGSSGYDLRASCSAFLPGGVPTAVPVGIRLAMPLGVEAQIRSRSGLALQGVTVANSPGTVDCDYRGEVQVILVSRLDRRIERGQRIAQLVFAAVLHPCLLEGDPDETGRGAGGFGSTGER